MRHTRWSSSLAATIFARMSRQGIPTLKNAAAPLPQSASIAMPVALYNRELISKEIARQSARVFTSIDN